MNYYGDKMKVQSWNIKQTIRWKAFQSFNRVKTQKVKFRKSLALKNFRSNFQIKTLELFNRIFFPLFRFSIFHLNFFFPFFVFWHSIPENRVLWKYFFLKFYFFTFSLTIFFSFFSGIPENGKKIFSIFFFSVFKNFPEIPHPSSVKFFYWVFFKHFPLSFNFK